MPTNLRRSWAALATAAVLLVGCADDGDDSPAEESSETTEATAPDTNDADTDTDSGDAPSGTTPTADEELAPSGPIASERRDPVEVGTPADFGDGLVVTVTEIEAVDIDGGGGPGTTAGPGVVVYLNVENATDGPVSLSPLTVMASSTSGEVARPADLQGVTALRGDLEPGEEATGGYPFRYDGDVSELQVDVIHSEHSDVIVVLG